MLYQATFAAGAAATAIVAKKGGWRHYISRNLHNVFFMFSLDPSSLPSLLIPCSHSKKEKRTT
jgi:hypothetical protein